MTKEEIGRKITAAKGELTYYKLSKLTNMPQHQLQKIEKGENYTIDSLLKYMQAVGLNIQIK